MNIFSECISKGFEVRARLLIIISFLIMFFNDSIVQGQTVVLAKKYRGSFQATTPYSESLAVPSNQISELYKLSIKNGDGILFVPKVCSGNFIQRLVCGLRNTVSSFTSNLNKVDWANVKINNVEIVNATQLNKTKVYYETVIKLEQVNQVNLTLKGSILSYVNVELKYLGEAIDQTPPVLSSNVSSGVLTNINFVHISIVDKSNVTNEIYKDGVLVQSNTLKEFDLSLTEGINSFVIKSKDSLNNVAQDLVLSNISLDTTPPTLLSDIRTKYLFDNLPGTIMIHFTSNEDLSSAEIDGQGISLLTPLTFEYSKFISETGNYNFNVKIKDKVGNESLSSFSYEVEETFSLTVVSPLKDENLASEKVNINIKSNKVLSSFFINNQPVPLSSDKMSITKQIRVPIHGKIKMQARGIAGLLEKTKDITFEIGKNTIAPWKYEECPSP